MLATSDPSLLAADFIEPNQRAMHYYVVIMHHEDRWHRKYSYKNRFFKHADTQYMIVTDSTQDAFRLLQQSEVIFTSSLHEIVFAHALSRSVLWMQCGQSVGGTFKFRDYFNSVSGDRHKMVCEHVGEKLELDILPENVRVVDVSALIIPVIRELLGEDA